MSRESFSDIQAIVTAHQAPLAAEQQDAVIVRQGLDGATDELRSAQAALQAAQSRVDAAKVSLAESQLDVGASHNKIAAAAREVATVVIKSPGDEVVRSLFGIIYQDETLARNDDSGRAYSDAAEKAGLALASILDRLIPGEPILHIGEQELIIGKVPQDEAVVSTLPQVSNGQSGNRFGNGSLDLRVEDAVMVTSEKPFVGINRLSEWEINLLASGTRNKVRRLTEASENTNWLVVGQEDITKALKKAEPWGQYMAMTALKEAGIEVEFVLDEDTRLEVAANLVVFITYLATRRLAYVYLKPVDQAIAGHGLPLSEESGSFIVIEDATGDVELDDRLQKLQKVVSASAMKTMAQVLGFNKETLRLGVEAVLKDLDEKDGGFSTPEVHADPVNRVVNRIFDS